MKKAKQKKHTKQEEIIPEKKLKSKEKSEKKNDKTERTYTWSKTKRRKKKKSDNSQCIPYIVVLTRFISQKHFRTYRVEQNEKEMNKKCILAKENSAIHQQITKQTKMKRKKTQKLNEENSSV